MNGIWLRVLLFVVVQISTLCLQPSKFDPSRRKDVSNSLDLKPLKTSSSRKKSVPGINIRTGEWTLEDAGSADSSQDNQVSCAVDERSKDLVQHRSVMTGDKCISLAISALENCDFEEAINLLNVAVAEKVDEHGQRSAHCVEGYYLFAKAIIGMLESTRTANRSDSAPIPPKIGEDKLKHIPIWSSSSSGSDSALDETDDDDEMEEKDAVAAASPDHTAVEKEDGGKVTPQSSDSGKDSDSESLPELVAWRLLRRSEEILTSQAASAPQQEHLLHQAGPLSRVQALLRWFAPHEHGADIITSAAQAASAATAGDPAVDSQSTT